MFASHHPTQQRHVQILLFFALCKSTFGKKIKKKKKIITHHLVFPYKQQHLADGQQCLHSPLSCRLCGKCDGCYFVTKHIKHPFLRCARFNDSEYKVVFVMHFYEGGHNLTSAAARCVLHI